MSDGNPTRNAQAKTAAFDGLAVACIAAEKRIENPRQQLGSDTLARVGNRNFRIFAKPAQRESHCTFGLIVLDCIVSEVQQKLTQSIAVSYNRCGLAVLESYGDIMGPRKTLRVGERLAHQFIELNSF